MDVFKIPVIRNIYANEDLFGSKNIERYIYMDEESLEIANDEEVFGIRVMDDSMEPRYQVGDIVFIRKTEIAGEGEPPLIVIRNKQAAIRNVLEMGDDHILLFATNPKWPPQCFNKRDISVIGMVVMRMG